jgi:hypothetical protein
LQFDSTILHATTVLYYPIHPNSNGVQRLKYSKQQLSTVGYM